MVRVHVVSGDEKKKSGVVAPGGRRLSRYVHVHVHARYAPISGVCKADMGAHSGMRQHEEGQEANTAAETRATCQHIT